MTPKEIVIRAIGRAKADILFEIEELELSYDHPCTSVDEGLLNSFASASLNHLVHIIEIHRKERRLNDSYSALLKERGLPILKTQDSYALSFPQLCPVPIRYIPEDLDDILLEYGRQMAHLCQIVESLLVDMKSRLLAGKIIETSIESLAGDLLNKYNMHVKVVCQKDGAWKCILESTQASASIAFFSDAEHIREDIDRCAQRIEIR